MTLIFAHRGFAGHFPENTMLAFIEAEKVLADGIELDIQLSKDDEIVVIHDEKVDRTTDGKGFVKDFTLQELRKLNAGVLFGRLAQIPLLEEVLEWLTTNQMVCNIELKNGKFPYLGMEEKVIELVRKFNLCDRVIFSSFNHYSMVHCYRIAPEIEIAPLLSDGIYMPWIYTQSIRAKGYHPQYRLVPNELILKSLEAGIAVRPYTVNSKEEMERLVRIGCTAFITDFPDLAYNVREEIKNK